MYEYSIWTITLCRPYGPSLLRVLGKADCRYRGAVVNGLPEDKAHHYFWGGYWDGPIDGWIYVRGQFYYFAAIGDALIFRHRLYGVYYVPKSARIAHLVRHRSFCHEVGWHCNRKPGEDKRWFSAAAKPNYEQWYETNKTPLGPVPKRLLVGVTTLRDGIVHWLDNPNEFSREWQFLDDDDDEDAEVAA